MHLATVLPVNPPTPKGKRQWDSCDKSETKCDDCGQEFTVKEGLRWHIGKCAKITKMFHDSRRFTPANKKAVKRVNDNDSTKVDLTDSPPSSKSEKIDMVSKPCPECDLIITANDVQTLINNMKKHNTVCKVRIKKCCH